MASVSVATKKILLRNIYWGCSGSSRTLLEGLQAFAKLAADATGSDIVLSGSASNGASVNYTVRTNSVSPMLRAELAEEYLEKYDAVKSAEPEGETFTDEQILAKMLALFVGGNTSTMNFGGLEK